MTSHVKWFHSFTFPSGEVVTGDKPEWTLIAEADAVFRFGIAGKSVLDIGAWDGFFSFEAERRGASRVLATDHFCWSGPGWGTKDGFNYAYEQFDSRIGSLDVDVPDLNTIGETFDVVLFLGVLYHLKDPVRCLETVASVTGGCLVVETVTTHDDFEIPVAHYHVGSSLRGDPTNFWTPNRRCLEDMLRDCGFSRFEAVPNPSVAQNPELERTVMHAWR
ncbi:MAG: class I SAM-dependent methyltransferase [Caulobacteraceae bacterium]